MDLIFINSSCTDPYINHAVEEYILKYKDTDCFILWRNRRSILIGKNQNTLREINLEYVKEKGIDVVRRVSGGGTVFCDLGNLNFTFITKKDSDFVDFKGFTKPIINALKKLGVDAEFNGRNDLTVEGKKFCGNAQYSYKNKVLHHGTLLFDADLSDLVKALKSNPIKFKDKAIKSVSNRVTNIRKYLNKDMNVEEFKNSLIKLVMEEFNCKEFYELNKEEMEKINKISEEKFSTWQWTYGNSPKFQFFNEDKFKCGVVQISLSVKDGNISNIKVNGDFFGMREISQLENMLLGKKYDEDNIKQVIKDVSVSEYISDLTREQFMGLMFNYK